MVRVTKQRHTLCVEWAKSLGRIAVHSKGGLFDIKGDNEFGISGEVPFSRLGVVIGW